MPKIVRSMRQDNGKPALGPRDLGVRLDTDIIPDEEGNVLPEHGGMSVAPFLQALDSSRIPKRLRALVPDARGSNNTYIWTMGTGEFVVSPVTTNLTLRPDPHDPTKHGFVEPSETMPAVTYIVALEETVGEWVIEEDV